MKRNIAIVAGGDSSEIVISLKSAEGIFSFLDKDKYNVYIAIVKRDEWAVKLPGGEHTPIDKNDLVSVRTARSDILISPILRSMELREKTDVCKDISI